MYEERDLKSKTIDEYLSGLRLVHLTEGFDLPYLKEPIVKLILSGKHNWDNVRKQIEGNRNKRDPITLDMMKFFKKKLLTIDWTVKKKILFHAVSTLAWNGSFRIHELLSKEARTFDSSVTLLCKDIKIDNMQIEGKTTHVISVFVKSPKVDRIGAGQRIEVFETGSFMCPYKALMKYMTINNISLNTQKPLFREENGECLTGRKMNAYLEEISMRIFQNNQQMYYIVQSILLK